MTNEREFRLKWMSGLMRIKSLIKGYMLRRLLKYEPDNLLYPYRKYFLENECIFIHVPKVAGTSILSVLSDGKYFRDHCSYKDYQQSDPIKFKRYFKFAFVRNPYDRLVSAYLYLLAGGNQMDDLVISNELVESYPTFDRFVLSYLDQEKIYRHNLFKPQHLFLFDFNDNLMVDYLGRFETIEDDYNYVAAKLGISIKLPSKNASSRAKVSFLKYYKNEDVLKTVYSLYKLDFELFKYNSILDID